jgi:hypothetical protein
MSPSKLDFNVRNFCNLKLENFYKISLKQIKNLFFKLLPKSLRKNSFLVKYKYWQLNSEQNSVFSYFTLFLFFEELLINSLSAFYIRNILHN